MMGKYKRWSELTFKQHFLILTTFVIYLIVMFLLGYYHGTYFFN